MVDVVLREITTHLCDQYDAKKNLKIKDLTGAGDLFAGGFLHGLINGKSIKECLELANKVAGISTTKIGAGEAMPFNEDIKLTN